MLRYRRHVQSFTAAEIAAKLEIAEKLRVEGKRVYEIARILGVTDTTYYNWLKRAATPVKSGESELRRENAQLKRAVKSLAGLTGSEPAHAASEATHDRLSV
jgi:transposase-like protein